MFAEVEVEPVTPVSPKSLKAVLKPANTLLTFFGKSLGGDKKKNIPPAGKVKKRPLGSSSVPNIWVTAAPLNPAPKRAKKASTERVNQKGSKQKKSNTMSSFFKKQTKKCQSSSQC